MKKVIFAIDCDEVLRSLISSMVKLYNREFNENLKYSDIKDFMVDVSFPKILEETGTTGSKWFFQDHSTEMFLESRAMPKIREAIDILKKYGEVIIVTYQKSFQNKIETLNWLEKHKIIVDGICFLKDKTILKANKDEQLIFIDDNDWNMIGSQADIGILIEAPYNKEVNINELQKKSNCKQILYYKSLYEFAKDFEKGKIV